MNRAEMKFSRFFLAWLLLLYAQHLAHAQGAASTMVGSVTDPSGAAIPTATITIENTDTGMTRQIRTDETGGFSAPNLPTGQYVVTVTADGFKTEKRTQIRLEYQQTQRVDFTLALGNVSQSVTVSSGGATLQTDDASAATVLGKQQITDLPLDGRNFVQLAQLVPGTTVGSPGGGNTSFTNQGFTVSAYGQRDYNNQYTLDGMDMTEARNPSPMFLPSVDAIQEFDVKTGLYSAQYGWKAGAHVDIAVKSGTNQFHGNVYEFLRNDIADARNYFDTSVDNLKRNQFGGTLGGPIKRNKLFFFGAYDQTRQNDGVTQTGVVPTPQQLSGNFSSSLTPVIDPTTNLPFPGNIIPSDRINPNATILGAFYPTPNVTGAANFVRSGASFDNNIQWFTRADYNIRDNDHLFGRFAYSNGSFGDPPLIADFATNNPIIATNGAIQEVHIFTPKLLNSFLIGFGYYHREESDATVYTSIAKQLSIPGVDDNPLLAGIPSISILGYSGFGQGAFSPLIFHDQNFAIQDNLSIQKGAHSINIGFEVIKARFEQTFVEYPRGFFDFTGYVTGNPIADFLLGLPLQTQVANALTPGHLFNTPSSYYVQDDWKATPKLTVNAGLRYELNPPVHDARGFARNLDLQTGELFPTTNIPVPLWNLDKTDIAPRFSFAYRPFDNDRTVLRGGIGLFYSTPELNLVTDANLNPPFGVTNSFEAIPGSPLSFENPYPTSTQLPQGAPTIYADAPNLKNARTVLWNLDVQHSLKNVLVDIGYTGSKSTNVALDEMPNQPTPGPGNPQTRRLLPQYGTVEYFGPAGFSNYNGLAVKVEKRLSSGLFLLGSYTYSKAIDQNDAPIFGDSYAGGEQNKNDLLAERGTASFSFKHVFSFSYGYELPFGRGRQFAAHLSRLGDFFISGWQTNGIVSWYSGPPFSVFVGGDPAGIDGDGTLRPDRIANGNLPSSQRRLSQWFDTNAFVAPPPYTFGSAGRDILIGPGTFDIDASLFKSWSVERLNVELRGEAFNATNHPNFGIPGQTLATPTYGVITSAGSPRLLQIAAKVRF
jgi:hypothetical protein